LCLMRRSLVKQFGKDVLKEIDSTTPRRHIEWKDEKKN
jgi:hypothetical protein